MTTWQQNLAGYYRNRGKIKNWAGVLAMKDLETANHERAKNREAESAFARRQWGQSETDMTGEDDMGHTILGDIHNPAPIIVPQQPQQQSTVGPLLAGAAIGAMMLGVPAAGVAGYMLSKDQQTQQVEPVGFEDSTVSIGLGRIEDYVQPDSSS